MTLFVQREILLLETTILNLFILKPAATPKRCTRPPENVSYPETFSAPHCLPFLYPVPLSVRWNSFVQRASVFDPFCLIIIYHTFSLTAFLTFPLATLFTTSKCIQRSVRRLSSCCFFFFQDLLSLFSLPLQLSFCHPNIYRQIPAQRDREEGERERGKKRQTFLHSPGSDSPKNLHWHTGVDCIVSPMQTRCEALMYGSVFFFFFFPSKEDKCRPKM